MSVQANLERVLGTTHFRVPKAVLHNDALPDWLASGAVDADDAWLIPCTHTIRVGASDSDLSAVQEGLGQKLPDDLVELLKLTDGADLFCLHYWSDGPDDYWISRYRVLSCSEVLEVTQRFWALFRSLVEDDDRYSQCDRLNYLAFCDVNDGNYLAVVVDGTGIGNVFYLDHEYGGFPHGDASTREAYCHVASSVSQWLAILAATQGARGLGDQWISL